MKTFKVVFKGKKRGTDDAYRKMTVLINLKKPPILPELNKSYLVWDLYEIWEKIY